MTHVSVPALLEELTEDEVHHRKVLDTGPITVEIGRYSSAEAVPNDSHSEEEIYYIVDGSGTLRVGTETYAVEPGDMVYVEPAMDHEFVDVETEITALIVFGPSITSPTSYSARERLTDAQRLE